jgi:hypothetical protein
MPQRASRGQAAFKEAALASSIRLNGMFLRAATSKDATLTSLIRLSSMLLYQAVFNPLH